MKRLSVLFREASVGSSADDEHEKQIKCSDSLSFNGFLFGNAAVTPLPGLSLSPSHSVPLFPDALRSHIWSINVSPPPNVLPSLLCFLWGISPISHICSLGSLICLSGAMTKIKQHVGLIRLVKESLPLRTWWYLYFSGKKSELFRSRTGTQCTNSHNV